MPPSGQAPDGAKRPSWPKRFVSWFAVLVALFTLVRLGPKKAFTDPAASASASASASATPAASGSAKAPEAGAIIKIHDRKIWNIQVPRAGRSPQKRAASASQVLIQALEEQE